jgi:hypothetical protein
MPGPAYANHGRWCRSSSARGHPHGPVGNVLQPSSNAARLADGRSVGAGPNDRLTGLEHRRTRLKLRAQAEIGRGHGGDAHPDDDNSCNQRNSNDLEVSEPVGGTHGGVIHDGLHYAPWGVVVPGAQGPSHRTLEGCAPGRQRDVMVSTKSRILRGQAAATQEHPRKRRALAARSSPRRSRRLSRRSVPADGPPD